MKIKKLGAALFLGMGMAVAFSASAFSDYESCIISCIQKRQICLNAGAPPATCESHYQRCRWNCGTPQ